MKEDKADEVKKEEAPISYSIMEKMSDVQKHWAKHNIAYVTPKGLMKGTEERKFEPEAPMTRGMFITVMGRMANVDEKQ